MTHAYAIAPSDRSTGVVATIAVHGLLLAAAWAVARQAAPAPMVTYEVTLLAAPMAAPDVKRAPPEAAPAKVEPTVPTPKAKVTPAPVAPPPPPTPANVPRADKVPVTRSPTPPAPGETPSTGRDALTLKQAGLVFPYPEYLNRIENAIHQRWDHAAFKPGFDARYEFTILPDGTVPDATLVMVRSSGNPLYDERARTAIESASNQHAFGPLPTGFVGSLPVVFDFVQDPKGAP